jgi:hypothetical protein
VARCDSGLSGPGAGGTATYGSGSRAPTSHAGDALARKRYWVLAKLAAQCGDSPVMLASSAPAVSSQGDRELTVAVSFDPGSCQFIATRVEGATSHRVDSGPSLTLACSAANQALETLAPLESLIRERPGDLYRRTRPQYLQEVHFCEALKRLGELAGVRIRPL